MALGTNGTVIDDACWLRPINDAQHINLAELDTALKGINLALQWEATVLHLVTDLACVHRWISKWKNTCEHEGSWQDASQAMARNFVIVGKRIWTDHRRETREVLSELHRWMDLLKEGKELVLESCAMVRRQLDKDQVANIHHQSGHPGAKQTLYFARLVNPQASKETANSVVKACETCRSIDPAPIRWKKGELGVTDNWKRLAMDITHHNGENFLTIIDCGPSRFTIWRPLR